MANQVTMMRIAIAGSGGLAQIFAHYLHETVHPFIILSRTPKPELEAREYQVMVVDYNNQNELEFALRGVDIVISTISGNPQITLIDAAARSRVRRFIPAEFEGPPTRRPPNDPLDYGKSASIDRLRHWSRHARHPMRYTIFACGVFYERFARGGLASMGMGSTSAVQNQGSYIMDVERSTASIVERTSGGQSQPIYLCMTSAWDVGRFLVAALEIDIQAWPAEFRMCGDRKTVAEVLAYAEHLKGGAYFLTEIIQARDLAAHLQYATYQQDHAKAAMVQELIATDQRRYDFTAPNLNALVDVVPTTFWDWLSGHWGAQP